MSLMKRYADDVEDLSLRAAYAAWETTHGLRVLALEALMEDCRTASAMYADPETVQRMLIDAVTDVFLNERFKVASRITA